jgi:hypothetical protein
VGHVAVSVPHEELQHPFAVQSLAALHFFHDVVETWRVGDLSLFELCVVIIEVVFGDWPRTFTNKRGDLGSSYWPCREHCGIVNHLPICSRGAIFTFARTGGDM